MSVELGAAEPKSERDGGADACIVTEGAAEPVEDPPDNEGCADGCENDTSIEVKEGPVVGAVEPKGKCKGKDKDGADDCVVTVGAAELGTKKEPVGDVVVDVGVSANCD